MTYFRFSRAASATVLMAGLAISASAAAQTASAPAAVPVATPVAATSAAIPPKIDSSLFAKKPFMRAARISPNGLRIAFMSSIGERTIVGFRDLADSKIKTIGAPPKYEIDWFSWAGDDKLLIALGHEVNFMGEEKRQTALLVYDRLTDKISFIGKREQGLDGDEVIYTDPAGNFVLLSVQPTIYEYPSVYRADLASGKLTKVQDSKDSVWTWVADNKGVVRLGVGYANRKMTYYYRGNETDAFRKVASVKVDEDSDERDLADFELTVGSDEGYVLSNKQTGRYAVHKFNFATRQLGPQIFGSDRYDLNSVGMARDGLTPLYTEYVDDVSRTKWFDPVFEDHQVSIDKALGKRNGDIRSWSQDGRVILVTVSASNDPGALYAFLPAEGQMRRVARRMEGLLSSQLAETKVVSYKARDGLDISGYLTVPMGRSPKGLPLIIMPHGGPYGVRDQLQFDAEVQFLANRGYVVLQPNYRGSGGFGKEFHNAGRGEFGRKMQDDLDDGMDWLVAEGIVDRKRVCLVGSSYGGYAALWGATRNPERYRCAASFAGVSDLKRQIKYDRGFLYGKNRDQWRSTVTGDDATFDLNSISALPQVARLTRPVLLAHGEEDSRVQFKQSKLYADALAKAGKEHEFYAYKKEGHGFENPVNMKHWLDHLEAFLTKHNPA